MKPKKTDRQLLKLVMTYLLEQDKIMAERVHENVLGKYERIAAVNAAKQGEGEAAKIKEDHTVYIVSKTSDQKTVEDIFCEELKAVDGSTEIVEGKVIEATKEACSFEDSTLMQPD